MNGYDTLLHIIVPGKNIVIKVEYGLQLHFKIFLNKPDRKHNNKNNHSNAQENCFLITVSYLEAW